MEEFFFVVHHFPIHYSWIVSWSCLPLSRSVLYNTIVGCIETFRGATKCLVNTSLLRSHSENGVIPTRLNMRHNVTTMKYHNHKCSANSSINPILCHTNTLPSKSCSSVCQNIITFLHLHSLRLNSSDWNNKHQVSEHVFIIWAFTGDPHIGGYKKYI